MNTFSDIDHCQFNPWTHGCVHGNCIDEVDNYKCECDLGYTGTDCNSHSKLWGCKKENNRGEILSDFLLSKDLHLMNKGNKPTFENSIRTEILDITFCNGAGLNFVENWEVRKEITFSHPTPIFAPLAK